MSPLVALLFLFRPTPMMTRLKEIKKDFFQPFFEFCFIFSKAFFLEKEMRPVRLRWRPREAAE